MSAKQQLLWHKNHSLNKEKCVISFDKLYARLRNVCMNMGVRLSLLVLMTFAMVNASALPMVSFLGKNNNAFLEICTTYGLKQIPADSDLPNDDDRHCPYCHLRGKAFIHTSTPHVPIPHNIVRADLNFHIVVISYRHIQSVFDARGPPSFV